MMENSSALALVFFPGYWGVREVEQMKEEICQTEAGNRGFIEFQC